MQKFYIIISEKNVVDLMQMVNAYIDHDYEPLGGVAFNKDGLYIQAMVKTVPANSTAKMELQKVLRDESPSFLNKKAPRKSASKKGRSK